MAKQPKRPTRRQKIEAAKIAEQTAAKVASKDRPKRDFIGQRRLSDDLREAGENRMAREGRLAQYGDDPDNGEGLRTEAELQAEDEARGQE